MTVEPCNGKLFSTVGGGHLEKGSNAPLGVYPTAPSLLATLLVSLTFLRQTFEGQVYSHDAALAARMREHARCLKQEGAQWPLTLTTTPSATASIPLPR
jgi:hypothetical protein